MDTTGKGGKTALITGASGGIGLDLAKVFAREGYNLILVARSEDKLDRLKAKLEERHRISARVLTKDLSDPAAPQEIYDELQAASVQVDMLVNNAGFTVYGPFVETDTSRELELLQVNIVALTHLTKLFLPAMVARGQGRILNLASTAAFLPGPLMAVYYASKAYVLSFSEALAEELDGTGVTVTALCPGLTETGFQERGSMESSRLMGSGMMSAAAVAKAGYHALMKGQVVAVPGVGNWAISQATRFVPRSLLRKAVRRGQERVDH